MLLNPLAISMTDKPRVVKDYDKLEIETLEQIKLQYPYGFEKHLVRFQNKEGKLVSALPFETEEKYYLVRMTLSEAQAIIREDDDYNDSGRLKSNVEARYTDRYSDDDEDEDDDDDNDDFDEVVDPDDLSEDDIDN